MATSDHQSRRGFAASCLVLACILLSACQPTLVTVEVTREVKVPQLQTQQVTVESTQIIEVTRLATVAVKSYANPHPILGDVRIRQAIALCTNKAELIQAVYPSLTAAERAGLVMNTFIPRNHWAYSGDNNATVNSYPFRTDLGKALLEQAGWKLGEISGYRANERGDILTLKLTTTNSIFRQTWTALFEKQMKDCGIQVLRFYVPPAWLFGTTSGLNRRDFEMAAFARVSEVDPNGQNVWTCDQIPTPDNGWLGQNDMGWCNPKASAAVYAAENSLVQTERKAQYLIAQQEFAKDMPALPLFSGFNLYAYTGKLTGFKLAPGQAIWDWNIETWQDPLKDTLILGLSQEPVTLNPLDATPLEKIALQPVTSSTFKVENYTYSVNRYLKELPTVENGQAQNSEVNVKDGDPILDADGNPVELKPGVKMVDSSGKTIVYAGGGSKMKQLKVSFQYLDGIKWSDGQPLKQEDFQLGYQHDCDKESGAVSYRVCDQILKVDFAGDTRYTITFRPGAQPPTYMATSLNWYPAHRVIAEGKYQGKTLKEVPAQDWDTLKEIVENPIGTGPYVIKEWSKGQYLYYEANPFWYGEKPKASRMWIKFIDPARAETLLFTGEVDFVGNDSLTARSDALSKAQKSGKVGVQIIPSSSWETIDFNLYTK
jgi:ABC-type transport system substrate-binding protein